MSILNMTKDNIEKYIVLKIFYESTSNMQALSYETIIYVASEI